MSIQEKRTIQGTKKFFEIIIIINAKDDFKLIYFVNLDT